MSGPLDLIRAKDGSWSLTKMAATTAHALMAAGFARITVRSGFLPELWMIYGSFAIGHAVVDKASAQIKEFKDRKVDAETPGSPSTVTETITKTKETT